MLKNISSLGRVLSKKETTNIKGGGGGGGCLPGFFACHCDGEFQGCYTTVQFCILICKNT